MRRIILLILALALVLGGLLPASQPARAAETAVLDTPIALVDSGVTRYTLAAPKVYWYTGVPPCPPGAQVNAAGTNATQELISRIATYGGLTRQLYNEARNCNQGQVYSNIVADSDFLYWIGPSGLMKLSTSANPGDAPLLMSATPLGASEVAVGSDKVFALSSTSTNTKIWSVAKATGNADVIANTSDGNSVQLGYDGTYIYFITNGSVHRLTIGVSTVGIAGNFVAGETRFASAYYAEGTRSTCGKVFCIFTQNVYVGIGNQVYVYNSQTSKLNTTPIYTSVDSQAQIDSIATDAAKLYIFESRPSNCGGLFCQYTHVLNRTGRGGGTVDGLYTYGPDLDRSSHHLTSDGTYLFWQESDKVQRLAGNAAALPSINLRATGLEVTQGIQNTSNGVLLVQNRRTFVRFYVKSDGAAVAGVTAALYAPTLEAGPLSPVNAVGTNITVRATPDRNDLNQSFLFELPWSWTQQPNLTLRAVLNPGGVPLEPSLADNTASASLAFKPSPSLTALFFRLNYKIGSTVYSPRITADVLKTYSWIMRAYPIGGAIGGNFKPQLWDVAGDTRLGNWVNRSSGDCTKGKIGDSDLSLCASFYTNGWLDYYRSHAWVPNTTAFYYGMISDGSNNFPRGQARFNKTSVGPSGTPCSPFNLGCGWDTDGSYADWYAGHEMGHSLGRAHPTPSAATCGNSASDNSYPYPGGQIGPSDGTLSSMEGFDVGDPSFSIVKRVYPGKSWFDVMSYCSNQWISDYTYTGMYNYMVAHPSLVTAADAQGGLVSGDFLQLSGVIDPLANQAAFALLRRLNNATPAALTPGDYSIRLLDAANNTLATYAFTPDTPADSTDLGFNLLVNFVAGTRQVQVVKVNGGQVLVTAPVSANPPMISNVALQGAPNPVSGVVTVSWTASDPDGDPLTFDIFYSRDNGQSFQPALMGATGNSTQLDTAQLGGSGTALLRVVASDGVNTAEANSAPFVMSNKPPQPFILQPGENTHVHYGQLVNFNGMAFDVQDQTVADSGLQWKNAKGEKLGDGALLSLENLPVGNNVITLQATNSVGAAATTTVTVVVDDNLDLLGPTLTVGPTIVGWQVTASETQTQTAQLTIGNAGNAAMEWQVKSNQPWLTLSASSGSVTADGDPFALTVTTDPNGLPKNATALASVTISNTSVTPTQVITVPVSLSVGDVRSGPTAPEVTNNIYLPVVVK